MKRRWLSVAMKMSLPTPTDGIGAPGKSRLTTWAKGMEVALHQALPVARGAARVARHVRRRLHRVIPGNTTFSGRIRWFYPIVLRVRQQTWSHERSLTWFALDSLQLDRGRQRKTLSGWFSRQGCHVSKRVMPISSAQSRLWGSLPLWGVQRSLGGELRAW
jgi:hypothetical protein